MAKINWKKQFEIQAGMYKGLSQEYENRSGELADQVKRNAQLQQSLNEARAQLVDSNMAVLDAKQALVDARIEINRVKADRPLMFTDILQLVGVVAGGKS